jgi:hypothetical protein
VLGLDTTVAVLSPGFAIPPLVTSRPHHPSIPVSQIEARAKLLHLYPLLVAPPVNYDTTFVSNFPNIHSVSFIKILALTLHLIINFPLFLITNSSTAQI